MGLGVKAYWGSPPRRTLWDYLILNSTRSSLRLSCVARKENPMWSISGSSGTTWKDLGRSRIQRGPWHEDGLPSTYDTFVTELIPIDDMANHPLGLTNDRNDTQNNSKDIPRAMVQGPVFSLIP